MRDPQIRFCLCLSALVLATLTGFSASAQNTKEDTIFMSKPSWRIDLRDEGWVEDEKLDKEPRFAELRESPAFLSNGTAAAIFLKRDNVSKSTDASSRGLPFSLNVIFIDVSAGKVVAHETYRAGTANAGLFPVDDGSYLIFAGDHISLFASNRSLVKDLPLPAIENPKLVLVGIAVSPSGHTTLVRYSDGQRQQCIWVSAPQMQMKSEACQLPPRVAVSDHELAAVDQTDPKSSKARIAIQKFDGPWHLLCDSSSNPACGNPQFVDDSTVLVYTVDALAAVHPNGQVIFTEAMFNPPLNTLTGSINHSAKIAQVRSSVVGNRIAAGIYAMTNLDNHGGSSIDVVTSGTEVMFDHTHVYDLTAGRWLLKVENDNIADSKIKHLSGIALSPDGSRFAIENSGVVRAFELPH